MSSPSYSYQKKYDAVIIGAGVIGCSIAFFLARESKGKFKVALVDRNIVGDEASGGAAGMLAAQIETEAPGPFLDLQIQSREIFKGLVGELEGMTGIPLPMRRKAFSTWPSPPNTNTISAQGSNGRKPRALRLNG